MSITLTRTQAIAKLKRYREDDAFKAFKHLRQERNGDWYAFENTPVVDGVHWIDNVGRSRLPIEGPQVASWMFSGWDAETVDTVEEEKKLVLEEILDIFGVRPWFLMRDREIGDTNFTEYGNSLLKTFPNCVFFDKFVADPLGYHQFTYTFDSGATWTRGNLSKLEEDLGRKK
jgi:hypothetical protein